MPDADTSKNAETAAEVIRGRMAQLALSQAELVRASGVSDATIRRLTTGVVWNYREPNLRKLSQALQWPSDAIERLLAGQAIGATEALDRLAATGTVGDIHLSASGADLEELRLTDPEAYEQLLGLARLYLDRARARREHQ